MRYFHSLLTCLFLFAGTVQLPVQANTLAETTDKKAQLKFGLTLIEQKKYSEAEIYFQNLSQQFPQQMSFLNNLAVAQMAQGKTKQALESLKTAAVADKHFSITEKNMNDIYAYMASQAYSKALDKKFDSKMPELVLITDLKTEIKDSDTTAEQKGKAPVISGAFAEDEASIISLIEKQTASWAKAWMNADIKNYIASYSHKFDPTGSLSYKDWVAQRRYRLRNSKNVNVSYNQLNIYLNAEKNSAIAEFIQQYKAGQYQDKVRKQLYWHLEGDRWLISREQVTEKL